MGGVQFQMLFYDCTELRLLQCIYMTYIQVLLPEVIITVVETKVLVLCQNWNKKMIVCLPLCLKLHLVSSLPVDVIGYNIGTSENSLNKWNCYIHLNVILGKPRYPCHSVLPRTAIYLWAFWTPRASDFRTDSTCSCVRHIYWWVHMFTSFSGNRNKKHNTLPLSSK